MTAISLLPQLMHYHIRKMLYGTPHYSDRLSSNEATLK